MQVSREFLLQELRLAHKTLGEWIDEVEAPGAETTNGEIVPAYKDGVPPGIAMEDMEGVRVKSLRAELLALAGKFESIAST